MVDGLALVWGSLNGTCQQTCLQQYKSSETRDSFIHNNFKASQHFLAELTTFSDVISTYTRITDNMEHRRLSQLLATTYKRVTFWSLISIFVLKRLVSEFFCCVVSDDSVPKSMMCACSTGSGSVLAGNYSL